MACRDILSDQPRLFYRGISSRAGPARGENAACLAYALDIAAASRFGGQRRQKLPLLPGPGRQRGAADRPALHQPAEHRASQRLRSRMRGDDAAKRRD